MASKTEYESERKFCLITGAASGLGLELAKIFAKNGYSLIIVDKNENKLIKAESLLLLQEKIHVIPIVEDLSDFNSALTIFNTLKNNHIVPEILVNNAGFGYFGFFTENDWEKQEDLIKLSVFTTTHLTKLFLPGMIANKKGHILNIASIAAFQPGPLMSVYHASKAFLLSISQALSNELKGTGVNVTVVCPGMMATGFQKSNNNEDPKLKWTIGSAEKVANYCYRSMKRNRVVAIPGLLNQFAANLPRLIPRNITTHIVRKMQEKNRIDFTPIILKK